MTTIVFDGKFLAADTKYELILDLEHRSHGKPHCPKCNEVINSTYSYDSKIKLHPNTYFRGSKVIASASAGYKSVGDFLVNVMLHSENPDVILKNLPVQMRRLTTQALILTEQHLHTVNNRGEIKKITKLPFAIGTGAQAALLSLKCGHTAARAIRMASEVDPNTSYDVMAVRMIQQDEYRVVKLITKEQLEKQENK